MTYLSHPVRRMCEEPVEGEDVSLRVTAAEDTDPGALAGRLDEVGTVEKRLRFGAFRVTVPQPRLDVLRGLDGIEAIETANTLGVDAGDAGEDVGSGE
ncbi:hypothetical protein [Salinirussus salinus]|jgi:hypothetical protein|uniref:hypothetical protein n=1 Tax=Salinirussus salinus TaxID=1198300 RepID=UPI001359211E|nr:hypothetical protein [Salinirussus salinus]